MRREPNFRPPQKIRNYKPSLTLATTYFFIYTVNRDPKCVDIITRIGRTDGAPFFFFSKSEDEGRRVEPNKVLIFPLHKIGNAKRFYGQGL